MRLCIILRLVLFSQLFLFCLRLCKTSGLHYIVSIFPWHMLFGVSYLFPKEKNTFFFVVGFVFIVLVIFIHARIFDFILFNCHLHRSNNKQRKIEILSKVKLQIVIVNYFQEQIDMNITSSTNVKKRDAYIIQEETFV
jgi:hypothetical protein